LYSFGGAQFPSKKGKSALTDIILLRAAKVQLEAVLHRMLNVI
jgi:hypothetical protein